ncbi:MAG: HAD family hydrolase [Planctomycetota bacterium]|nr:HAD family hydrolase [Planctomycetota bacterium]
MNKAIFLDRDGTIIDNQGDLGNPDSVTLIDGAAEGMACLVEAGWLLVVCTNQAGVARGVFKEEDVIAVHRRIDDLLEQTTGQKLIQKYYYCCWHPESILPEWRGSHQWRKPNPGMLLAAATEFNIDIPSSWMVGDTSLDIKAGIAAGCQTIWLSGQNRVTDEVNPTLFAPSLAKASAVILANSKIL